MGIDEDINKDLILREQLALQRTMLANQTTFLAFLRTSMYFLVAGLSIRNILKMQNGLVIEIILYAVSLAMFITGIINYYIHHKRIKRNRVHIGKYRKEYLEE